MQPKLPRSLSSNSQVNLTYGPPPKIYVGPKPRPGGPAVCWKAKGQELSRPGVSGYVRRDFTASFDNFQIQLEKNGGVTSFPIDQATIHVRNADGSVHQIDIVRQAGTVIWRVDSVDLIPGATGPGHDGLPPEFFGDYLGISGWSGNNALGPNIILD